MRDRAGKACRKGVTGFGCAHGELLARIPPRSPPRAPPAPFSSERKPGSSPGLVGHTRTVDHCGSPELSNSFSAIVAIVPSDFDRRANTAARHIPVSAGRHASGETRRRPPDSRSCYPPWFRGRCGVGSSSTSKQLNRAVIVMRLRRVRVPAGVGIAGGKDTHRTVVEEQRLARETGSAWCVRTPEVATERVGQHRLGRGGSGRPHTCAPDGRDGDRGRLDTAQSSARRRFRCRSVPRPGTSGLIGAFLTTIDAVMKRAWNKTSGRGSASGCPRRRGRGVSREPDRNCGSISASSPATNPPGQTTDGWGQLAAHRLHERDVAVEDGSQFACRRITWRAGSC